MVTPRTHKDPTCVQEILLEVLHHVVWIPATEASCTIGGRSKVVVAASGVGQYRAEVRERAGSQTGVRMMSVVGGGFLAVAAAGVGQHRAGACLRTRRMCLEEETRAGKWGTRVSYVVDAAAFLLSTRRNASEYSILTQRERAHDKGKNA